MNLLKLKIKLMKKICLAIMPKTYNGQREIAEKLFRLYYNHNNVITDTNKEHLEKHENLVFMLMLNAIILSRSNYKKYTNRNYRELETNEVYIKEILRAIRRIHHYINCQIKN